MKSVCPAISPLYMYVLPSLPLEAVEVVLEAMPKVLEFFFFNGGSEWCAMCAMGIDAHALRAVLCAALYAGGC